MIPAPPPPVVTGIRSIDMGLAIAPAVFHSPGHCLLGVQVIFTDPVPDDYAAAYADVDGCVIKFPPATLLTNNAPWRCSIVLHEWGHAAMAYQHMSQGIMRPVLSRPHPACLKALGWTLKQSESVTITIHPAKRRSYPHVHTHRVRAQGQGRRDLRSMAEDTAPAP